MPSLAPQSPPVEPSGHTYRYLLAFGSNVGDRHLNCQKGLAALKLHGKVLSNSAWISTEPLPSSDYDCTNHKNYLNFVIDYSADLPAEELYQVIVSIEDRVGHSRQAKWLPRRLDIDILFWAKNSQVPFGLCTPCTFYGQTLEIPHPGFWQRPFLQSMIFNDLGVLPEQLQTHKGVLQC